MDSESGTRRRSTTKLPPPDNDDFAEVLRRFEIAAWWPDLDLVANLMMQKPKKKSETIRKPLRATIVSEEQNSDDEEEDENDNHECDQSQPPSAHLCWTGTCAYRRC
jgi:hypothetical protein